MDFKIDIKGLPELERTFTKLPRVMQSKVYRKSLRAGATIIRNKSVENLKAVAVQGYSTGYAATQMRVYSVKKYRGYYRVTVQVRRGAVNVKKIVNGKPVRVGLYVAVLEYGKKDQPPRSWIRKAIREEKDAAIKSLSVELGRGQKEAVIEARK